MNNHIFLRMTAMYKVHGTAPMPVLTLDLQNPGYF